jgi:hypothetical protein
MSAGLPVNDRIWRMATAFSFWRRSAFLVGVGSAVPTRPGDETDGPGGFDPALGSEDKAVEARLFSNPIEFDGIEIGIIQLFPNAEKFDGIAVAQPVAE